MSFLIGTVSGALVAGGVYYGFSNTINTRTNKLRKDLHSLSHRFKVDPTQLTTPTASERITQRPFSALVQSRWNRQVDVLFKSVAEWDRHATAWARQILYGGDAVSKEGSARK
ncbi:hypothetical protein BDM02DRAFT_3187248 [Thelephora ganbajun]|uniref:Uncharacterized protein n=1 Tax=Thelephora ganbajun TaxID=370292 RepID=A0ACB6ZG26_THEGA|nr:hypothetical protein BDM02DRAFT_3187248 [Thelephora ganbajun]